MIVNILPQDHCILSAIETLIYLFRKPKEEVEQVDVWAYMGISANIAQGRAYVRERARLLGKNEKGSQDQLDSDSILHVMNELVEIRRVFLANWITSPDELTLTRDSLYYVDQLTKAKKRLILLGVDKQHKGKNDAS